MIAHKSFGNVERDSRSDVNTEGTVVDVASSGPWFLNIWTNLGTFFLWAWSVKTTPI